MITIFVILVGAHEVVSLKGPLEDDELSAIIGKFFNKF